MTLDGKANPKVMQITIPNKMDKQLKLTKTALENYAMLSMKLPMDDDGNWGIDYDLSLIHI